VPLVNRQYWLDRLGQSSPCWSGEKWLDWEHGIIARSAFRRIFPRDVRRVLDIGCGDGRWSQWMRDIFDVVVLGTDVIQWPAVEYRIKFVEADAEELLRSKVVLEFRPELAVFMNSLTCVAHWQRAVASVCKISDRVLAFDNFMTPTPIWWKNLPHRKPIRLPQLVDEFLGYGFIVEKVVAADLFHRRLFLAAPRWTYGAVATVSAGLDLAAARLIQPEKARHSAVLFKNKDL